MAYTTGTMNLLTSGSMDGTASVRMWGYLSADASGTFTAAGYVSDAGKKGRGIGCTWCAPTPLARSADPVVMARGTLPA
jgi:hypothetical protein